MDCRRRPAGKFWTSWQGEKKAFLDMGLNFIPVFISKTGGNAKVYGAKDALVNVL